MSCQQCGGRVGPKNKIGFCRACLHKTGFALIRARDPEAFDRARSEGMKRKYQEDPEYAARAKDNLRRVANLPHAVEARRESGRRVGLSGLGHKALFAGSEGRKQQARTLSDRKLAWCPRELRGEYIRLLRAKRMKKEEARAIILAQHEADIRRLRERMGVNGPVLEVVPILPREGGEVAVFYAGAEAAKAEKARIEALRQRRTLCPICGARSDVGCEHGAAA